MTRVEPKPREEFFKCWLNKMGRSHWGKLVQQHLHMPYAKEVGNRISILHYPGQCNWFREVGKRRSWKILSACYTL